MAAKLVLLATAHQPRGATRPHSLSDRHVRCTNPMRKVPAQAFQALFSEILCYKYASPWTRKDQDLLDRLRMYARRMDELLDDLLASTNPAGEQEENATEENGRQAHSSSVTA